MFWTVNRFWGLFFVVIDGLLCLDQLVAAWQRWARLSPSARIQTAINAHRLAAHLIRGRLRRRYPLLSDAEITFKMLAEFERDF